LQPCHEVNLLKRELDTLYVLISSGYNSG
jgi:hypothetical protein